MPNEIYRALDRMRPLERFSPREAQPPSSVLDRIIRENSDLIVASGPVPESDDLSTGIVLYDERDLAIIWCPPGRGKPSRARGKTLS